MEHTIEHGPKGGVRFTVRNPPAPGAKLLHSDGRVLTFNGLGMAGMLEATTETGSQMLFWPHEVSLAP